MFGNSLRGAGRRCAIALTAATAALAVMSPAANASDSDFPSNWMRSEFAIKGTTLVMDVRYAGGDGTLVWLYGVNHTDAQVWVWEDAVEGGTYLHPRYDRWLCLSRNGSTAGSRPLVKTCNGNSVQRWHIAWNYGTSTYEISPWSNWSLCIDVPNSDFRSEVPLQLWQCNNTNAQAWEIFSVGGW